MYAAREDDRIVREAGDVLCQEMRRKLTGRRPSNQYFRQVTDLGAAIADGEFASIAGLDPDVILMPYEQ
jgi:hypothetical protein